MSSLTKMGEIDQAVDRSLNELRSLGRRAVKETYTLGVWLTKAKRELPHGEFWKWHEAKRLTKDLLVRAMKLARQQESQIATLETVQAALEGAPKRLTTVDKAEMEKAAVRTEIDELKRQIAEAKKEIAVMEARRPDLYEKACAVSGKEEVDRNLTKLDDMQKRLRECQAASLEEAKELAIKEEGANLRRQIRKLKAA
ncbi:MAG: aminoacyltransferase [Gemmatimonadetes bacterium]|nr:aminoacyltransferase [Gemmatimonadota bacterium]MYG85395.1 aminoacyltransferase [Gemmatimonadota bacterium]MYJ89062.1 aminoacyltransferase [Gemmatimonadota bacterium]